MGFPISTPDAYIAFDTETTGLNPELGDRPFLFSFANSDGDTAYIRFPVVAQTREVVYDEETMALIQEILGEESITKVGHNVGFDIRMAEAAGLELQGPVVDTMLTMHVLNPDEMQFGLKYLGKRYLGVTDEDQKDLEESVKEVRARVRLAQRRKAEGAEVRPQDIAVLDWKVSEESVTNGKDPAKADYCFGDPAACSKYASLDAYRTAVLFEHQKVALDTDKENGGKLWDVLGMEMALQPHIRRMEQRGIRIDIKKTLLLREWYDSQAKLAKQKLTEMGLADLNPKSPKQVCEHFFGTRGLTPTEFSVNDKGDPIACIHCADAVVDAEGKPVRRETHTKTGKKVMRVIKKSPGCKICNFTGQNPKCDGGYLAKIGFKYDKEKDKMVMADETAYWMLRYDGCKHMLVNFFDVYLALADDDPYSPPGNKRLHPNYKQVGTVTGRLSCERPNLMQVASDDTPRKHSDVPYRARECFMARDNYLLYMPDYSQVEVWIFASLAKDETMLKILMSGKDFHGAIAHTVWGSEFDLDLAFASKLKPSTELNPVEFKNLTQYTKYRKRSKLLMFSKLYGGGPDVQAELMQTTVAEAKLFAADYDRRLPGIPRFMAECIRTAKEKGYVLNPFGRKFPIPRQLAYKATNYTIQGSAASVMKRSCIRIGDLGVTRRYVGRMFPLLNIHDEHAIEVHRTIHGEKTMRDIITAMQGDDHKFLGCPVPLPVGMKYSKNYWSDMQDVKGL